MVPNFGILKEIPHLVTALYSALADLLTLPVVIGVKVEDCALFKGIVESGVNRIPVLRSRFQLWAHTSDDIVFLLCKNKKDLGRCDLLLDRKNLSAIIYLLKEAKNEKGGFNPHYTGDDDQCYLRSTGES